MMGRLTAAIAASAMIFGAHAFGMYTFQSGQVCTVKADCYNTGGTAYCNVNALGIANDLTTGGPEAPNYISVTSNSDCLVGVGTNGAKRCFCTVST